MSVVSLAVACIPLFLFSLVAFWKGNAFLYLIVMAASLFLGLYWFDVYTTAIGLAVSLSFFLYSIVAWALSLRALLTRISTGGE